MAETRKDEKALIFITRQGLQYIGGSSKNILSLAFDPKIVLDLDVIDEVALEVQVANFISQNKLVPVPVMFLFAENASFYQDIKEEDTPKVKLIKEDFVNSVPFETLLTKVYKMRIGAKIVSINEGLYRVIASSFETKGFLSLGVIPALIVGGKAALATSLDPLFARQTLASLDTMREFSFLTNEVRSDSENPDSNVLAGTKKPTIEKSFRITPKFIALGIVFLILIGVLVFMIVKQSKG